MIKKMTLVLSMAFTLLTIQPFFGQSDAYYYYKGDKISLELDQSFISLNISDNDTSFLRDYSHLLIGESEITEIHDRSYLIPIDSSSQTNNKDYYLELLINESIVDNYQTYDSIVSSISSIKNVTNVSYGYTTLNDEKVGVTNKVYVKPHSTDDLHKLKNIVTFYGYEIIGLDPYINSIYTLGVTDSSTVNTIDFANILYDTGLFEFSEPEFNLHISLNSNDGYYGDQWGLNNTGQHGEQYSGIDIKIEDAWELSTGEGINVAIFDQGFELDHPDLIQNANVNYDTYTNSVTPVVYGSHGTPCAGIIGAVKDNGIGVAGIAPNSNLFSISSQLNTYASALDIFRGFSWAADNNIDVISNSWSGVILSNYIDYGIDYALNNGRDGKGMVVVFSTGNGWGDIYYPTNSDDRIISVGALNIDITRKSSSNYGTELDIMAPGQNIPSTDNQGLNGFNPHETIFGYIESNPNYINNLDYMSSFAATSAACPHVAGVAALILSINPDLTNLQVNKIIELTAQKVGDYIYSENIDRPNGDWNNEMGYGLVDAYEAVLLAQYTPTASAGQDIVLCNTGEQYELVVDNYSENSVYLWENSDGDYIVNENMVIYQSEEYAGEYYLGYFYYPQDENFPEEYTGLVFYDTINVSIMSPNIDLQISQEHHCAGLDNSISVNIEGDFFYSWSSEWEGFVSPGNTPIYEFNSNEPFDVTVSVFSYDCEEIITNNYTVDLVVESDELTLGEDIIACPGETYVLGEQPLEGYQYRWERQNPYNEIYYFFTNQSQFVYPTMSPYQINYKLDRVGWECGTLASDEILITNDSEYLIEIEPQEPICLNESITIPIDYDPNYTFIWTSDSETFAPTEGLQASLEFTPLVSQTCTLTVTSIHCPDVKSVAYVDIVVYEDDFVTTLESEITVCPSNQIVLGGVENANYTVTYESNVLGSMASNTVNQQLVFTPTTSQTITQTATHINCPDIVHITSTYIDFVEGNESPVHVTECVDQAYTIGWEETYDNLEFTWYDISGNEINAGSTYTDIPTEFGVEQYQLQISGEYCDMQEDYNVLALDEFTNNSQSNIDICYGSDLVIEHGFDVSQVIEEQFIDFSWEINNIQVDADGTYEQENITEPFQITVLAYNTLCDVTSEFTYNVNVIDENLVAEQWSSPPVFFGESIQIGIPNDEMYTYTWASDNPDFTAPVESTSLITVTPNSTYTYSLIAQGVSCNSIVQSNYVVNVIKPTTDFSLNNTVDVFCTEEPVVLNVIPNSPELTYTWTETINNGSSTVVSETSSYTLAGSIDAEITYDITVSGEYCSETISTEIIATDLIEIDLPEEQQFCEGDQIDFYVEDLSSANYLWTFNGVVISNDHSCHFTAVQSGLLEVKATHEPCGINTGAVNIIVTPTPEAEIVSSLYECNGSEYLLKPAGIDNGESYYFTLPDGTIISENTDVPITFGESQDGIYTLTVTSDDCDLFTEYPIELATIPLASSVFLPTVGACYGEEISTDGFDSNFEYQLLDEQGQVYPNNTLNIYQDQVISVEVSEPICNDTYSATVEIQIDDCCVVPGYASDFSDMTSSDVNGNVFENEQIYINNEFTVDNSMSFVGCDFYMGPNAKITIDYGELSMDGCTIQSCANEMWFGIVADDISESITIKNSLVRHAQFAVHSSNDAFVGLIKNDFEDNHIAALFENYDSGQLIEIHSNNFYSIGLMPPYVGSDASGIHCLTVDNITIGTTDDNPDYRNKFSNLMQGVYALNTSLTIINNDFVDSWGGVKNDIQPIGNPDDFLFRNLWVQKCNFTNLTHGMHTHNLLNSSGDIVIDKNNFSSISHDAIVCFNTGSSTKIAYNTVHDSKYAIRAQSYWNNLDAYAVEIDHNRIYNPSSTGIWVTNLGENLWTDDVTSIHHNEIHFNENLIEEQVAQGIRVENCDNIFIEHNNILREEVDLQMSETANLKGIVLNQTYKARVFENYIEKMGKGLYGVGVLDLSRFICNQFIGNYDGFYFEDNIATNITDQGSSTNPTDNTWVDAEFQGGDRVVSGEYTTTPNWYHRELFDYNPLFTSNEIEFIQTVNELPFVCSFDQDNNLLEEQAWLSYVAQDDYSYTDYNEEYKFRDKKDVFNTLKNEPELYLNDVILENFFNLLEESNLAKIVNVHEKMSSGEISEAIIENESIISDKLYVQNRKEVNSIYLNTIAQGLPLSETDSANLEQIAYITPYLGGDAVFSARVMLGLDVVDEGIEYRQAQESSSKSDITIYPNPSTDILNIQFDGYEHIDATVHIYDLSGRLLLTKTVKALDSVLGISSLSEGVYLLKITEEDKVLLSEQLIKLKK